MTDTRFPEDTVGQLKEADRLLAIAAIADVALEHDAKADEWVLSVSPGKESLHFAPFQRFNIPGRQIDEAIREGWGVVARAAQVENDRNLSETLTSLRPTVPTLASEEPALTHWLPTDKRDEWESPKGFTLWNIGPVAITRSKQFAHLKRTGRAYKLSLTDDESELIRVHNDIPEPYRIPKNREEYLRRQGKETSPIPGFSEMPSVPRLSSREIMIKETEHQLKEISRGEDLPGLIDETKDLDPFQAGGSLLGFGIGIGLIVGFYKTDSSSAMAALFIVSVAIWIIKRIIIFKKNY